jgi:hypothetical protein
MSDRDEPELELTPEQEAQVRRLLSDARHTAPMPGDVVARLDRVLAGLDADQAREATVVRLADRRRKATRWLVAAAAVVVVGVGGNQLLDGLNGFSGADDASSPAAETQDEDNAVGAESPESTDGDAAPQTPGDRAPLAKVRPQMLADDAATVRDGVAGYAYSFVAGQRNQDDAELAAAVCPIGDWGSGRYVAVRYAGDPGWIVFRKPEGDTQEADLFLCGSELARRSLTLPYP